MLSHRYIADRFLPDKAIDLMDEAASKLRMEIDSMPVELDEVQRRVMQLEIEREALRKETDKASAERLARLDQELADLKEQQRTLTAHWNQEKDAIQKSADLKEELDALRRDVEAAAAARRLRRGVGAAVRPHPAARGADPGPGRRRRRRRERPAPAQGAGRRGRHRRGGRPSGPASR